MGDLAEQIQEATGQNVQLAYVDQGYTGEEPARQALVTQGAFRLLDETL